jgi:Ca2+-binding RTX toxin-like protein
LALSVNSAAVGATFGFAAAAVEGAADSVTLTVSDLTAGTVTLNDIETINIVSNGDENTATLSANSATVLNISGAGGLDLTATAAYAKTINASTMTGWLTVTAANSTSNTITGGSGDDWLTGSGGNDVLTGNAGDEIITSGAGNDSISAGDGDDSVVVAGNLNSYDTVSGGAGTDDLSFTTAGIALRQTAGAVHAGVTDFETVTVSDALAGNLNTAYIQAGITGVTLTEGSSANIVTFEAGTKTLTLGTANTGILTVSDTGIATTDALTISLKSTDNSLNAKDLTITGFESVTIAAGSYSSGQTVGAITVTGDSSSTGVQTPATLTLTGSTSFTTSTSVGTGVINLGATTGTGVINASAMTGNFVMAAAAVGVTSIVGGSGNDTLLGTSGNSVLTSTIDGGAGNDAITGGSYKDSILGGDGNDTITGSDGNDYISAGAGTDRLSFTPALFTAAQTVDGGDGTDTLYFTGTTGTVTDAAFANKTLIETISSASTGRVQVELGALSTAAGVKTVTFAGTTTVVGSGVADSLTVPATFTGSTLAVSLGSTFIAGDTTSVLASAYTGTLTVTAAGSGAFATQTTKPTITGGTGTADKMNLVAATYTAGDFVNVSGIENITITNATTPVSATIPLSSGNLSSGKTLTINGSAIVDSALSLIVDGTDINAGQLIVTGSTGADSIVGSASTTAGDSLVGGTGNDIFQFAAANLASSDTVSGGDGTDVLTISGAGTLTDTQFTNISSVETLNFGNNNETITLGALAAAAGIATVTDGTGATTLNVGSGFTNNLTVALSTGADTVSAGTYTGALTVTVAAATSITSTDTVTAGTGTSDTLRVTFANDGLASADLVGYTGFETIKSYSDVATGAIYLNDTNIASAKSLTADFTANATTIVTISAAAESNGSVTILTGGGADVITASVSSYGDSISAGSGNDSITIATAQLTSNDTINGGEGTDDFITFSDAGTVADVAFSNVSNVERVVLATGTNTLVAGAEFQEAGAATIVGTSGADSITIGSGVTRNITVNMLSAAGGNDSVVATGYTGALTVTTTEAGLTSDDTVTGGSGTDTLLVTITNASTLTASDLSKVTKFEVIKTVGDELTSTITLSDANAVSSSITVDTTSFITAANQITVDASGEDDSTLVYIGGAGINVVTGTSLGDTITGGAAADTIYGGAGNDSISGGSGNDSIVAGTGVDTLTGGAGNDTFQINSTGFETGNLSPAVVYYGGVVASGSSVSTAGFDKITDFGAGDSGILEETAEKHAG